MVNNDLQKLLNSGNNGLSVTYTPIVQPRTMRTTHTRYTIIPGVVLQTVLMIVLAGLNVLKCARNWNNLNG